MYRSALSIVRKLKKSGYEAYFAGGCVRDELLGKKPKDYDIATSALPDEIEKLMPRTIPVGKAFGVVIVLMGKHKIEVTTFRKDHEYKDGRHPNRISFCDAQEDALRRDFTINGLFLDPISGEVIDFVNGRKDLQAGVVRFIGDPEARISEDHLRILRGVRLKNALGFSYDPKTREAIVKNAHLVAKISPERVRNELLRMLENEHAAAAIIDLDELGILQYLIPELIAMHGVAQPHQYHHEGDVWIHALFSLKSVPKKASPLLRLAALFHDIAKPQTQHIDSHGEIHFFGHDKLGGEMVRKILKRLKFSSFEIETVSWLIEHHMMMSQLLEMSEKRRVHWFSNPHFSLLLALMKADILGTRPSELDWYRKIAKMYREWLKSAREVHIVPITGGEIMKEFGLKPGKQIGELLHAVIEEFLEGRITTKEEAIAWVRKRLQKNA